MDEKGISPEKPWMEELKQASGSAFLGTLLRHPTRTFTDACYPTCQLHQKLCDTNLFMIIVTINNMKQSIAVLTTFFLMMIVHPAVQEKAQAEIDAVVGRERMPTMDDRPSLPFIDAIFRELLRYNTTLPLCE